MMSTDNAYMSYKPLGEKGPEFRWHGGAYIDVGYTQDVGQPGVDGDNFHAYDVINVWDYATDTPTIERSLSAFQAHVDEWLKTNEEEGY